MELGAEGSLVKQQGDEREEGLAEFQLFLFSVPVKVKKMDPNHAEQRHQLCVIKKMAKGVSLSEGNAALGLLGSTGDAYCSEWSGTKECTLN